MPATGLDHVNIRAPRDVIEQVRDFYRDALGLRVGNRPPFRSQGYWLYAGDRPVMHLSVGQDDGPRETGAANTLDHVAFNCADLPAMQRQLDALGNAYTATQVPLRRQVQLFMADPAGNRVELNFAQAGE